MTAERSVAAFTLLGGSIATARRVVPGTRCRPLLGRLRRRTRSVCCPILNDFFRGDRTSQHNAHITTIREIAYAWHPWHGKKLVVVREVKKAGQSVVHCRLEDSEVILAIPLWMFDRPLCSSFREQETPEVEWRAIRELGQLLCDAASPSLEQEHSTVNPGGNAHAQGKGVVR